ncbi:Gfo/Idh/MocA family oxidoreductase [Flavobacterium salilacus subsp. salilacus]|uniref:Gfo/Idh/MocA family protein n=1 Tax=Flavobacterium TaxID=237 RepID=UPI0010753920|nr:MULTISPECIES: Gfo/Idh/MocA family oxidoreductase [Flavobacterium]KAF2520140.1 Gfo/Idh/MocA family oxidoreductase [Flavobacterium salilacus subsp. salilacus]MBE1613943.1 Gfo/Idh/MocA family oxidoreductase [Flavobacterium sp. SaA2.13]
MDSVIKWGIIGCGNVTERKSGPAYTKTEGFKLQAVMRRDMEKAADYAHRHGVPAYYNDADALINDPEVDAVYIATPPDTHMYYALKVADAGKPCCIEKPMAPNYAECVTICRAFEDKNLPLFVAYYRRSLPRFKQVREWIDAGAIGEPRHINWLLTKTPSPIDKSGEYNWRTDAKIAVGGYFDDLASHGLDLFIQMLGNITMVQGITTNQQGLYTAKDAVAACWLHNTGVTGSATWNFGSSTREDSVTIHGSEGKIDFSVFEEEPVILTNAAGRKELFIENPENIQLYHVQNMREHLMGNARHPSTGNTGAHTSWVLDTILGTL